ncbi:hypothetical protein ACFO25_00825 [Paenactinomyces guangxiensis]|uniref:Uncharacterized protein n=1 Tax=Paenactinomyces guangxiensis TaxID=1490290 RepID=A0A7W1WSM9_9BACL|nr:hypothetical protein [Paenactinomyces guangxiensis]MBA4495306.1 hypothetical protein [Paenactinomyces guangxiensis]MBH8592572.1 hypothetical protein [Paenactinomyces guangxiensis]
MIEINSYEDETESPTYDCVECGQKNCVVVKGNNGFCSTPGCLHNDPIQFVYYPHWEKPKTSRAGREFSWDK